MTPRDIADGLSELDVLALTLHHEAGGEPLEGQAAVGCVVRNRAERGIGGRTVRDVCLARAQFSCWQPTGGEANFARLRAHVRAIRDDRQRPRGMRRAYELAAALLGGTLQDVTNGADHYFAPAAMRPPGRVPVWARGLTPTAQIGGHVFFRLSKG
jgi:spore germination cell wall hydrolase CwlJ-like protein